LRYLNDDGTIAEPTSKRNGQLPDDDAKRERRILRYGWLLLLIPIAGIIPYSLVRNELTDRWGHRPWWL